MSVRTFSTFESSNFKKYCTYRKNVHEMFLIKKRAQSEKIDLLFDYQYRFLENCRLGMSLLCFSWSALQLLISICHCYCYKKCYIQTLARNRCEIHQKKRNILLPIRTCVCPRPRIA